MNIFRKIAAAALSAALILFLIPDVHAGAADEGYIIGEFRYMPSLAENSIMEKFYYSDGFFAKSGKEKDIHLRTMSLDLALSVFGSDSGHLPSESAEDLLTDIGFDTRDIYVADMNDPTSNDTLGTVMSHKKTKYGEVVAVAVRGGGYGLEWGSNLMAGEHGDAEGFSKAAKMLADRIRAYEIKHGIMGAKIWMAGYSRAGGVSELAGKYINEHLNEFGMTADDLYVYTFEAPAGSMDFAYYENIHNIANPNDIVPLVYPETWGLYHTGVTEKLAAPDIPINRKQLVVTVSDGVRIQDQRNYEFDTKTFRLNDMGPVPPVNTGDFVREFINWLASRIDRIRYAESDEYAADVISMIIGNSISGRTEFMMYLTEAIVSGLNEDMLPLLYSIPGSKDYEDAVESFVDGITDKLFEEGMEEKLTAEESARLRTAVPKVIKMFMPAITTDLLAERSLEHFATFMGNAGTILMQHSEAVVLELVKSEDPFFNGTEDVVEAAVTTAPPVTTVTAAAPKTTAATTTSAATTTITTTTTTTTTTSATTTTTTTTTTMTTTTAPETIAESSEDTTTTPTVTTAVTETEQETEPDSGEEFPLWIIAAGAAGGVMIIVISGIVVWYSKKR